MKADSGSDDLGPATLKELSQASRRRAGQARKLKETDCREIKCGV